MTIRRAARSDRHQFPYPYVADRIEWVGDHWVKRQPMYAVNCSVCGEHAGIKRSGDINRAHKRGAKFYCARSCQKKPENTRTCNWCGQQFQHCPQPGRDNRGKYCSRPCYNAWQKTEENAGENHPSYTGGNPGRDCSRQEYRRWREAVFARDDFTCQGCGTKGGRLRGHHIKPFCKYPELELVVDNGATLCYECHNVIHEQHLDEYPISILEEVMAIA